MLRIALRVVGRQRVVNFLAKFLAKLIQQYVGPQAATTLSRAMVDVGLRLITLETEEEAPPQVAARAVAATLEDTVRRLAESGFEQFDNLEESLDQQQLLEALATEAFFESAIAHFPAQLLDGRRLEEREMYFEVSSQPGVWVARPRPRYKKYSRVYEVTITPQVANQVRSFGATTLAAFLRARGVRLPVAAKVHLYESIPGDHAQPDRGAGTARARARLGQGGRLVADPSADHAGRRSVGEGTRAWQGHGAALVGIAASRRRRAAVLLPRTAARRWRAGRRTGRRTGRRPRQRSRTSRST